MRQLAWALGIIVAMPAAAELSSYAGQQSRAVKSLSEQEVADLLAGNGMGLAKAAELNRYPGPRHVLDLGGELGLSEQQIEAVRTVFARMRREAQSLGAMIVERETMLDRLFAEARIGAGLLEAETAVIAELQGRLRRVHLAAHLDTRQVLTTEQVDRYTIARGYGTRATGGHETRHH
jgi:hypothetical protein